MEEKKELERGSREQLQEFVKGELNKLKDASFEQFRENMIKIGKIWFEGIDMLIEYWEEQFDMLFKAVKDENTKTGDWLKGELHINQHNIEFFSERLNNTAMSVFAIFQAVVWMNKGKMETKDKAMVANLLGFDWGKKDEEEILLGWLMGNDKKEISSNTVQ